MISNLIERRCQATLGPPQAFVLALVSHFLKENLGSFKIVPIWELLPLG